MESQSWDIEARSRNNNNMLRWLLQNIGKFRQYWHQILQQKEKSSPDIKVIVLFAPSQENEKIAKMSLAYFFNNNTRSGVAPDADASEFNKFIQNTCSYKLYVFKSLEESYVKFIVHT